MFTWLDDRMTEKGVLYIVATPIGNLDDITLRALKTLKEVEYVAAEDTRHSGRLLKHFGIKKKMISFQGEREKSKTRVVLDKIRSGFTVALISDAGTPGISDPGGLLIKEAIKEGIEVSSIPGPAALISAAVVSGFLEKGFLFLGFPSRYGSVRKKELTERLYETSPLILYESPHRIVKLLKDMLDVFGNRRAVLCRELTKLHEEIIRGRITEILDIVESKKPIGEYMLVVEGAGEKPLNPDTALNEVHSLINRGMSRKDASAKVSTGTGISKSLLYRESLKEERKGGQPEPT